MNNQEKAKIIMQYLAKLKFTAVDRFGNMKFSTPTGEYRYKALKNVIRFEKCVHHEATQYSPASKSWILLKSYSIKELYDRLKSEEKI